MSDEDYSKKIERIIERLDEIKDQLLHDTEEAAEQYEAHRQHLWEAMGTLPEQLRGLEGELAEEALELKRQLQHLEVRMTLARMDREDAWQEQIGGIRKTLTALGRSVEKVHSAETEEGLFPLRDFAAEFRKLEDKLSALHVHCALRDSHLAEDLVRERKALSEKAGELALGLKEAESHDLELLKVAGEKIKKASSFLWRVVGEFFQYVETDEQRREREQRERETPD